MKQPLVSFIVPVYNAEKTIERCVTSLQKQTVENIEILLIDDGSRDNSFAVCESLAKMDSRIIVYHQKNAGVSVARNVGIGFACGNYISFVDADDWIDANVCEVFEKALQKQDYDLFCFSAIFYGKSKDKKSFLFAKDELLLNEKLREELHLKVMTPWAPGFEYNVNSRFSGMSWGKFFRSSILKSIGECFKKGITISEDTLFLILNFQKFEKVGYSTRAFYHYIFADNSAQNRYRPDSVQQFSIIINQIKIWLAQQGKDERFINSANTLFVHYLFGILKEDLFHRDNKENRLDRRKQLRIILASSPFADALVSAKWSYFSMAECTLVFLLKMKMVWIISLLMKFVV